MLANNYSASFYFLLSLPLIADLHVRNWCELLASHICASEPGDKEGVSGGSFHFR